MTYPLERAIQKLKRLANLEKVAIKRDRFGITASNSLGIYHSDLKMLAQEIGPDHSLALELMESGIYEARLLSSKIMDPAALTPVLMDRWALAFENWEICDSFCMGVFTKTDDAIPKAIEWSDHEAEFVKRAAFTIMAAYGFSHKQATNDVFEGFLPMIERESIDDRLYVKKAVNWALRNIGKRNVDLHQAAIKSANRIHKFDEKSAKWVARHALRQLQNPNIKRMDYPREIYRKG